MSWTLSQLAARLGAELDGPDKAVERLAPLNLAGPDELTICSDGRRLDELRHTRAAGVLLPRRFSDIPDVPCALLIVDDVRLALAAALELVHPAQPVQPGIDPQALVHSAAQLDPSVRVEQGAQVGEKVRVGPGTVLASGCVVLPGAEIGRDCRIGAGAVVYGCCRLGDRVRVGPGCVLGSAGFGFVPEGKSLHPIPQVGSVEVGHDVDLGANCTVDRGTLGATTIGDGTKIDNLVQVGHNVTIGRDVCIAAQCGLSGSVTIGDGVMMGGQVGVADRLTIGAGSRIGAKSGVGQHLAPGSRVAGYPAVPIKRWLRNIHLGRRVDRLLGLGKEEGE